MRAATATTATSHRGKRPLHELRRFGPRFREVGIGDELASREPGTHRSEKIAAGHHFAGRPEKTMVLLHPQEAHRGQGVARLETSQERRGLVLGHRSLDESEKLVGVLVREGRELGGAAEELEHLGFRPLASQADRVLGLVGVFFFAKPRVARPWSTHDDVT